MEKVIFVLSLVRLILPAMFPGLPSTLILSWKNFSRLLISKIPSVTGKLQSNVKSLAILTSGVAFFFATFFLAGAVGFLADAAFEAGLAAPLAGAFLPPLAEMGFFSGFFSPFPFPFSTFFSVLTFATSFGALGFSCFFDFSALGALFSLACEAFLGASAFFSFLTESFLG